ncbi:MAG TPA: hypothetical protein VMZ22_01000 [Acidimicrobiales bacterium]|nr:hypothetical protein [Acidimicrobiales bacterium]
MVDEQASNRRNMSGRRGFYLFPAARRHDHVGTAPVRAALLFPDEPALGHASHMMRQPALLPAEGLGEFEEPHPAVLTVGQRDQHDVVGVGEARVGGELARQLRFETHLHELEGAPRSLLTTAQPTSGHLATLPH